MKKIVPKMKKYIAINDNSEDNSDSFEIDAPNIAAAETIMLEKIGWYVEEADAPEIQEIVASLDILKNGITFQSKSYVYNPVSNCFVSNEVE